MSTVASDNDDESKTPSSTTSAVTLASSRTTTPDHIAWHEELRVFEAKRRLQYANKLEICQLHHKSYRQLLQDGMTETERAHRLLLGLAQAQKILATSLRSKKYVRRKTKTLPDTPKSGFMESLNTSTDDIKAAFGESSQRLIRLDEKVQTLLQQSLDGIMHLTERGNSILELMEKTQINTTAAWDIYFQSSKSSNAAANPALLASPDLQHKTAASSTMTINTMKHDQWLAEVTYRSRVQTQVETWATALDQLSKLFAEAQKLECRRRTNIRECMIAFSKQQEATIHQAEAAHASPLNDWIGRLTTKEDVEKDIKESIEKLGRAARGLEDLDDDSYYTHFNNAFAEQDPGNVNKDAQSLSDRLSIVCFYEELFTTGLDSDYIIHTSVVEVIQKAADVLRSNYALCVVTTDGYLHLFLLAKKLDTPNEAFAAVLERQSSGGNDDSECSLRPDESFAISRMIVTMSSAGNKIDISSPKEPPLSLITASRQEQMLFCGAFDEVKSGAR